MDPQPLAGRTIAVPETRELEVFAAMLERRGASVVRCPLVAIRDAPDPAPVLAFARAFAAGACDDLILTTGEGLRRILGCIERHEPPLRAGFLESLGRVRKITRGPKPARALRELGMKPDLPAPTPTTAGVIAALAGYTWITLQWSYSDGERAGYVQKLSRKGWLCKTWEGEMAMVTMPGTVAEKFAFTVREPAVVAKLNANVGRRVALHYEQHKWIPSSCFGDSEYFVTDVRVTE